MIDRVYKQGYGVDQIFHDHFAFRTFGVSRHLKPVHKDTCTAAQTAFGRHRHLHAVYTAVHFDGVQQRHTVLYHISQCWQRSQLTGHTQLSWQSASTNCTAQPSCFPLAVPADKSCWCGVQVPGLGLDSIGSALEAFGYTQRDYYTFPRTHLLAAWYAPPQELYQIMPRMFVSQLQVGHRSSAPAAATSSDSPLPGRDCLATAAQSSRRVQLALIIASVAFNEDEG